MGLCDSCYPKKVPEKPPVVRAIKASGPRQAAARPNIKFIAADQRVYHVTHISNLESILQAGAVLAGATPTVDVSSELTRELRRTAEVTGGATVDQYVPFYLAPEASAWADLRGGAVDPRWSAAGASATPTDFVFLVTTVRALGPDLVITDGDAAGSVTQFATGSEEAERMLRRLHGTEELLAAEALVKNSFPFEAVQLIGVANDRVRDRVRDHGMPTRVAVYPPWFQL